MKPNLNLVDVDILTVVLRRALYLAENDKGTMRLACTFDQFQKSLNFCSFLGSSVIKRSLLKLTKAPFDLGDGSAMPVIKEISFSRNKKDFLVVFDTQAYRLLEKNFYYFGINYLMDLKNLKPTIKEEGEKL